MDAVGILTSTVVAAIVFFFVGLSVFTLYVLYRHYRTTRSKDYLIIMIFLMGAIMNTTTGLIFRDRDSNNNVLRWQGRLLLAFSALIVFYFLYLHGARVLWETTPKWLSYSVNLLFFVDIVDLSVKVYNLTYFEERWLHFDQYISNIIRVITGLVPLYAYITFQPIDKGKHVQRTRLAYEIIGLVQFTIGFLNLAITILSDSGLYNNNELDALVTTQSFVSLFGIFGFLALFLVTVYYPESLLISEAQISRIRGYYEKVMKSPQYSEPTHWKLDHLKQYLAHLPPELFENQ